MELLKNFSLAQQIRTKVHQFVTAKAGSLSEDVKFHFRNFFESFDSATDAAIVGNEELFQEFIIEGMMSLGIAIRIGIWTESDIHYFLELVPIQNRPRGDE